MESDTGSTLLWLSGARKPPEEMLHWSRISGTAKNTCQVGNELRVTRWARELAAGKVVSPTNTGLCHSVI